MKTFLITGATGNVGLEVLKQLQTQPPEAVRLLVGLRAPQEAERKLAAFPEVKPVRFDFEAPETFAPALEEVDRVFLLRPPHISDVEKYFAPLVKELAKVPGRELVFISVQGVEKSTIIPHHKIEALIRDSGLRYIFLRPSYFMQNLTTTLLPDIQQQDRILLPAGKAPFLWVDVQDLGELAAQMLLQFDRYANGAYELTGNDLLNFEEVARLLSQVAARPIHYQSPHLLQFFWQKYRQGVKPAFILVMIMLHYLPRFQEAPRLSSFFEEVLHKKPTSLKAFLNREKAAFLKRS